MGDGPDDSGSGGRAEEGWAMRSGEIAPTDPKMEKNQSGLMAIFTSLMFILEVGKRKTLVVSLKTVSISPLKALAKMLKMFS